MLRGTTLPVETVEKLVNGLPLLLGFTISPELPEELHLCLRFSLWMTDQEIPVLRPCYALHINYMTGTHCLRILTPLATGGYEPNVRDTKNRIPR